MFRGYKFRLYPTEAQKQQLEQAFGGCRFVYNLALELNTHAWRTQRKKLNYIELSRQLTELKATEAQWLKQCPSQALVNSLIHLDKAFDNFFNGKRFPKFKRKNGDQTLTINQGVRFDFEKGTCFIPKLKHTKVIVHRKFDGKIISANIHRSKTGKYYIGLNVETQDIEPIKKPVGVDSTIGVDLGILNLITLSNGEKFDNPRYFRNAKARIRRLNRALSRSKKGSKRREKRRLLVAKAYEKLTFQRNDYLHKITSKMVKSYDTVVVEGLNIAGLLQNRRIATSITEVGWRKFKDMLEYKCQWYGKNFIVIGQYEPSSRKCSICGTVNKELLLQSRSWTCLSCGTCHDRDINAAVNIKNLGLGVQPSIANASLEAVR